MSRQHRGEYQTHTSHLVPSMGPIVSVVTLMLLISLNINGQQVLPRCEQITTVD